MIERITSSRWLRRAGWAYVVFWILSSGVLAAALLTEALLFRRTPTFGRDVAGYVIVMLGFPLIAPGLALTGGIPGDTDEHAVAIWSVTLATLVGAIVGWWTLGSALWRRLRRRATP